MNILLFTFIYKYSTISGIRAIFAAMIKESVLKKLQGDYVLQGKIADATGKGWHTVQRWIVDSLEGKKSGLTDIAIIEIIKEHFNLKQEQILA